MFEKPFIDSNYKWQASSSKFFMFLRYTVFVHGDVNIDNCVNNFGDTLEA